MRNLSEDFNRTEKRGFMAIIGMSVAMILASLAGLAGLILGRNPNRPHHSGEVAMEANGLASLLSGVAREFFTGNISIRGRTIPVAKTTVKKLGVVTFLETDSNRLFTAIEQNPETGSRWAGLARAGHKVVQFKELHDRHDDGKYIGVAVDGNVTLRGSQWKKP